MTVQIKSVRLQIARDPPSLCACSADASTAARENRSGVAPGQPAAAKPSSWQGAPGLAFQPLHPSLQLHAEGVGTGGPYSSDVSNRARHEDADAAAVPAAAYGTSWRPARHGMLVPSAGREHSQLPQPMLPQHMLPAEVPAQLSGIGQAGLPAADAPDRQAADQVLQQEPPGPAAQRELRQQHQAVPDAEPQLAMIMQREAEAWGVQKWQAAQAPAAGMPPLAGDLVAAAVHSQAQWLGSLAPGKQPQAMSMLPSTSPFGAVSASTQQVPVVSSDALAHDSAAMIVAAQPANWRSSAGAAHSREPRGGSRQESGVPASGHQQLTLLPSQPVAPMPHTADTDGDTLQQLIARAERLRLMLDGAVCEPAAVDWHR